MSSHLFYGSYGTGKTTLAARFIELGYTVHIIDTDKKALRMHNLQPLFSKGLSVETINEPLCTNLEKRVKSFTTPTAGKPAGLLKVVDIINREANEPSADVVVLDSMTRLADHMKRYILHMSGKVKFEFDEWAAWLQIWEDLIDTFVSIPCTHQILIGHERAVQDDVTGKVEYRVAIEGQFSDRVGTYLEEIYYCFVETGRDTAKFMIQTKPDKKKAARTCYELPTVIEVDEYLRRLKSLRRKEGGEISEKS